MNVGYVDLIRPICSRFLADSELKRLSRPVA
jgi:hypothetical protein